MPPAQLPLPNAIPSLGSIKPRHIAALFGVTLVAMQLTREAFMTANEYSDPGRGLFQAPSYDNEVEDISGDVREPSHDQDDHKVNELTQQLQAIQDTLQQQQAKLQASEQQQEQQLSELKQLQDQLQKTVQETTQEKKKATVAVQSDEKQKQEDDNKKKEQEAAAAATAKVVEELRAELQSLKDQVAIQVTAAPAAADVTKEQDKSEKHEATLKKNDQKENKNKKEGNNNNNSNSTDTSINAAVPGEFVRQDGVVIATKIHGEHQLHILEQMLCLLTKAYNDRMKYDVIIFTTEPLSKESEQSLHILGAPAKIRIVVDNPGLQQMIQDLSPKRKETFLSRCGVQSEAEIKNITWFTECRENGMRGGMNRIAYNWQAEFRSWHIWKHKALKPYQTMLWIDADAFPTKVWDRDPIAVFRHHQLVIAFQNFPAGKSPGGQPEFVDRFLTSFGKTITEVRLTDDGHLTSREGKGPIEQIHGFMHITNLDFYRSKRALKWSETLIGDDFLARRFDDQLAVTAPAVVWAPEKAWHLGLHGIQLKVFHNGMMDGGGRAPKYNFKAFWNNGGGKEGFPEEGGTCPITANGR